MQKCTPKGRSEALSMSRANKNTRLNGRFATDKLLGWDAHNPPLPPGGLIMRWWIAVIKVHSSRCCFFNNYLGRGKFKQFFFFFWKDFLLNWNFIEIQKIQINIGKRFPKYEFKKKKSHGIINEVFGLTRKMQGK